MQTWVVRRSLDSLYLSPGIDVTMWSATESVHIEWDNSQKQIHGVCAWTAVAGSHTLPRDKFAEKVRSLNRRLVGQMAERVEQVLKGGALDEGAHIDLEGLCRERAQRGHVFGTAIQPAPATDWNAVRRSFGLLDASGN